MAGTRLIRKPNSSDPEEYKRFVEMAREVGADELPEAFERAFKKVVPSTPAASRPRPSGRRASS